MSGVRLVRQALVLAIREHLALLLARAVILVQPVQEVREVLIVADQALAVVVLLEHLPEARLLPLGAAVLQEVQDKI